MIGGLKDGTIEILATDHAPHAREKKMREDRPGPFRNRGPGDVDPDHRGTASLIEGPAT